jgi:hypothetical protein
MPGCAYLVTSFQKCFAYGCQNIWVISVALAKCSLSAVFGITIAAHDAMKTMRLYHSCFDLWWGWCVTWMGTMNWQCWILVAGSWHSSIDCHMCCDSLMLATYWYLILGYDGHFSTLAATTQDVIGWQNFMEGQLQDRHYVLLQSWCTVDGWTSGLVMQLLELMHGWYVDQSKPNITACINDQGLQIAHSI